MKIDFSRLWEISSLSDLTVGEMLYYGGFALAAVTVLLALIFLIFRPKYKPESATYVVKEKVKSKTGKTGKNKRSGDTKTDKIEIVADSETEVISETHTELLPQNECNETELVKSTQESNNTDIL